ncbi:PREDICTED: uncharacterized protein LOC106105925 isoform X5 [Papilio polytes]|uniref:uncharacterized protein LOC106105925 isoform X5 n=1 Tax=Papilio polytes TaxID=76194 RepID=UPI000676A4D9|nr:PREDICTED: uncharacterized protein LOC106105925 isoform X5 [Papilio polytes]
MANRSWGNQSQDWDPMRDDFNNSTFDPQYPDDNAGRGVQLDHTRIYITNLPWNLTDDGLRTIFSKYGTIKESFLSRDLNKRYALVKYETSGEAKLAMMKLNKTEPLKMFVNIAHKKRPFINDPRDRGSNHTSQMSRDETSSICSRGRNSRRMDDTQPSINSEGDMDDLIGEDELGLVNSSDPDLHLELVQLKMERIKLQEEKLECKRMMILNRAGKKSVPVSSKNRSVLADGRIVVRNNNDRPSEVTGDSESFGVGSGDAVDNPMQQKLPALQRDPSRACVSCGKPADAYCSRCAVTPYCSVACQQRDWRARHHSVCHNLARLADGNAPYAMQSSSSNIPTLQSVAPLRRPHSPMKNVRRFQNNEDNEYSGQARAYHNTNSNYQNGQTNRNQDRSNNRMNRPQGSSYRNQEKNKQNTKPQDNENRPNIPQLRRPQIKNTDEEDWNSKTKNQAPSNIGKMPIKPVKQILEIATEEKKTVKPLSVEDVTPIKKIVPKTCVVETLSVGDIVVVSIDKVAAECRVNGPGYIGVALQDKYETDYMRLCEEYFTDCEKEGNYTPSPGEAFSYLNEDGAWYRARCLSGDLAALIDSSALVKITTQCKSLPLKYAEIPEFSCYINIEGVEIGDNLKCTVKAKFKDGCVVVAENVASGARLGEGEVKRWSPEIEYPVAAGAIPEVLRPVVCDKSRVLLVEATQLSRAFVRSADVTAQRRYDSVLQGVVLYGQTAKPLSVPPRKGQLVVAKYTDGLHYRAVCKRTNVKQNKYLLEYIEFGNLEISKFQDLYPCPVEFDLTSQPAEASQVSLLTGDFNITPQATEYVDKLKDSCTELILTIPNGEKTAPSGAEVKLTVADTKECVNTKLEELCTPEWKKMEKTGVDVVESACIMYSNLEHLELPESGCEIEVLDISSLDGATISGYMKGEPLAKKILGELSEQMEAYCNSDIGKEPYLPKFEELCIAQCPPYPQWFRAVFCEQMSGAGGATARLWYIDYGNMEVVPVAAVRKMLPEFVIGIPALAAHLEIKDFPKEPTTEQLSKAIQYMEINEEGRGHLKVTKCIKMDKGLYVVDAPELIAAMME